MIFQLHEKNYYPANQQITEADAPHILPLWEGILPSSLGAGQGSRVLLHGPPSVGKSAMGFSLLNAVATGQQFLGRQTAKTPCLFVSLDMAKGLVFRRWLDTKFAQRKAIDFFYCQSFDCLSPMLKQSDLWGFLGDKVRESGHGLVAIDALREIHTRSMNDDDVPHQVYEVFREWFPHATVMFIHHTRKSKFTQAGTPIPAGDEDALGSRFWSALATVSLGLQPISKDLIRLDVGKSQAYPLLYEPLKVYLEEGTMECKLYDDARVDLEKRQYKIAEQSAILSNPTWAKMTARQQDETIGKILGVSARSVRRYRNASIA